MGLTGARRCAGRHAPLDTSATDARGRARTRSNLEMRETQTVVARLERLERLLLQGGRRTGAAAGSCTSTGRAHRSPRQVERRTGACCRRTGRCLGTGTGEGREEGRDRRHRPRRSTARCSSSGTPSSRRCVRAAALRTRICARAGPSSSRPTSSSSVSTRRSTHRSCRTSRTTCQRITEVLEQVFGRKLALDPQIGEPVPVRMHGSGGPRRRMSPTRSISSKRGLGAEVVGEVSTS